ncbi:MAG: surface carbohydrate biosynthesis protein [Gammaproteobacteria bacterium]
MTTTLYLPVENQVRELDAKLLFAGLAATRGYRVVLGNKQLLHFALPRFEPGVFIAKSMRARGKLMFDIIRGLGHELVAWDEESLVRFDSPEYYAWRFSPPTFNAIRHLFAWGEDDAAMFAAYPGSDGSVAIHATGNPRMDLLRPRLAGFFADECAALARRYGRYVLVNTNFSFVNPFLAAHALVLEPGASGERESRVAHGMSAEFARGMYAHQERIFEHFRALLPRLAAALPDTRIVLRPHPSENHEVWRELLAPHANIEVCHEGNVIPWLMSAALLLHNGCTTAVEASLAERPVVAYRPVRSETFDYALPNGLSHQADTIDEVIDTVGAILDGRLGLVDDATRARYYRRHLAAAEGPLACERILDVLDGLGYRGGWHAPVGAGARAFARTTSAVRTAIKRFNMRRRHHWASGRYNAHRYPGITPEALNVRLASLLQAAGVPVSVRATPCGQDLYRLDPAG